MRNFEQPGRSLVMATGGMAATSHPLATGAAIDVLRRGGSAIDGAIAACAMQCVVEPGSTGIGGDCFALHAPAAGGRVHAYNGSGRTPAAAQLEWFLERGFSEIPRHSPHAVTVPGAVDAWVQLNADHGRLPLGDLLQPAIRAARDGYPVAPRTHFDWADEVDTLAREPDTAALFLPGGRVPVAGDLHRQPRLAETLAGIAERGRDAFYTGPVAEEIVACLRERGGLHTLDDFAAAAGEYVEPVSSRYRDHELLECPPNGQGIIAQLILNILEGCTLDPDPLAPERVHVEIEAARLAYADRDALIADPAHAEVPVARLLGTEHAARLRAMIDPQRAAPPRPSVLAEPSRETVYIAVVDGEGNAASFINSLYYPFGSGILAPRSGVLLQCRGMSFSLEPGHPNAIAPGKRPMHTIIPAMLSQGGRVCMPFGVMGGHYQAFGHAELLMRVIDCGCDLQEAIDLPRYFPLPGEAGVEVESTVPGRMIDELRRRGHDPILPGGPIGGAQAIWIDHERGVLVGASDPRKDGCAFGY